MEIHVAAFYKFFSFIDYIPWKARLKDAMDANGVMGNALLAREGINATIAGSKEGVALVLAELGRHKEMRDLFIKHSACETMPFKRAKVRLKKEIITLGKSVSPTRRTGEFLSPEAWNALIQDESVCVLDTRNKYEVEKGTFRRADNPDIQNFRDITEYIEKKYDPEKHTRIATFCTGGIRCEKLTSWMLEKGYKDVYQLHGGILQYLQDIPPEQSLWQGECFVFDGREAVGHGVVPSAGRMEGGQ